MNRQINKVAILPKLHDYKGDVSKQWFVFYSYRNPANGKMKRFRIYDGFTDLPTADEKTLHGLAIIESIRQKLSNGWSPFGDDEKVIFEDALLYQNTAKQYGRMRETNKRFHYYTSQWIADLPGIRPSTFTTYKSKLRYFNTFLEESKIHDNDISEFTDENARQFSLWLKRSRNLENKTINEYNVVLKSFFKSLIDQKLLRHNPFAAYKPLKTEPKKPRIYSNDMLVKISEQAAKDDPQLLLAIRIVFNCFIRPGELRLLKLANIDFHRGKINVPASIAKDKTERNVDIPGYLLDAMKADNLHRMPVNYYIVSPEFRPGMVMCSRNFMYRRFLKLKKTLGISKDYIFYAFKHTGMVELKLSGADWLEVRNQAGHESLDQTIEYTTALMAMGSKHIRENGPKI